jgi:transcriptional regulator with XRE-family HTH domain
VPCEDRYGWTLKEMSKHSGIPFSTLSKVENGRLTLTYDKLQQVSQRLKIPMSELFAMPGEGREAPVTGRRSIGRTADAIRVTTPNYDYYYLNTELRRKRMIPIVARIRAKSLEEFGELVRHKGEELVYVITGSIEVHTEFYDPVVINEGELIYIDSRWDTPTSSQRAARRPLRSASAPRTTMPWRRTLMSLLGESAAAP